MLGGGRAARSRTRPGGQVASLESDTEYALCYPPHPAITRISEIFPLVFARNGADHHI